MYQPIIGILSDTMRHHSPIFGDIPKHYVNEKYVTAVEKNGGISVILPMYGDNEKLRAAASLCDGLLLPGGEDVDPALYGEGPHRCLGEIHPGYDRFAMAALQLAEEFQLPCLGICKGMQIMSVYSGGCLYQDMYSQIKGDVLLHCQQGRRDYPVHQVKLNPDSRLRQILGQEVVEVNSMHHQSIRTPGNRLKVTAWADDGIVEALEDSEGLWIGVQWHPEELVETSGIMNRLFADLTARASERRSKK